MRALRGGSNLTNRILVAIPAAIVTLICILTSPETLAIFVLVVGAVALHEFYGFTDHVNPVRLAGFITLIALIVTGLWGDQFQLVAVIAAAFPLAFLIGLLAPRRENATLGLAATLFGAFWLGIPLAHALFLDRLPHGDKVIIDILLGTFIGDTFAYAGGKMFGRHKLAPSLSPNKTQEGLIIGIVGATLTVWFAGLYQDWITGANALLLGLAVAVAAPLGDLFESFIKRDVGVKDSGRAFGAHGGALDRADAALFTIVAGYYVWYTMAAI
ncbi:MAG TPA: phosphatidate cytidylyltransferase [Solirubrobacterales bacterium]|jgi:phosphatidate cytidylyltransferase|nr:phosphatidate cytidylyltransferase [Solirubrobacterales bacterium]